MKQRLCKCRRFIVNVKRFIDCEEVKARQIFLADDKPLVSTFFQHNKLIHKELPVPCLAKLGKDFKLGITI